MDIEISLHNSTNEKWFNATTRSLVCIDSVRRVILEKPKIFEKTSDTCPLGGRKVSKTDHHLKNYISSMPQRIEMIFFMLHRSSIGLHLSRHFGSTGLPVHFRKSIFFKNLNFSRWGRRSFWPIWYSSWRSFYAL